MAHMRQAVGRPAALCHALVLAPAAHHTSVRFRPNSRVLIQSLCTIHRLRADTCAGRGRGKGGRRTARKPPVPRARPRPPTTPAPRPGPHLAPRLEAAPAEAHQPALERLEGEGGGQVQDGSVHAHWAQGRGRGAPNTGMMRCMRGAPGPEQRCCGGHGPVCPAGRFLRQRRNKEQPSSAEKPHPPYAKVPRWRYLQGWQVEGRGPQDSEAAGRQTYHPAQPLPRWQQHHPAAALTGTARHPRAAAPRRRC